MAADDKIFNSELPLKYVSQKQF